MFRVATERADLLRCFVVRSIVFVGEQRCPVNEEFDGLDAGAIHILGEEGGEPVAAGRIRNVDGWAKLERIAVLPAFRGRALGHALVEYMLEVARQRGFLNFKMHAQAHLVSFYRAHGFEPRGDLFQEAGIDHYLMVKGDAPLAEPAAATVAPPPAPPGAVPAGAQPQPAGRRSSPVPAISPTPYVTERGPAGTPGPHGYLHPELEYVGFGPRFVASLIDGLIIALITWPILIGFYGASYLGSTGYAGPLDFALTFVLPSVATILFWILKGATPGKMLIGARIVNARTGERASPAQCIGRYFAYFISGFALGIGFLWIAGEPHKQGWHDKLATTLVVRPRRHAVPVEFGSTTLWPSATQSQAKAADDWMPF